LGQVEGDELRRGGRRLAVLGDRLDRRDRRGVGGEGEAEGLAEADDGALERREQGARQLVEAARHQSSSTRITTASG